MPESLGTIVSGDDSGKSDVISGDGSASGNSRGTYEPEIIGGYESVEPATERISGGGNGPRLTKRGKIDGRTLRGKRASETGAQESVPLTKLDIAEVLYSIHLMGAEIFKTPELELDKEESTKLADAIKNVGQYYGAVFDPKKVAIFHLAMVAGGIYGTRFFAYRNRMEITKANKPATPKPTPVNTRAQSPQPINGGVKQGAEVPPEMLWGTGDATL
jgi:hypothetical protein